MCRRTDGGMSPVIGSVVLLVVAIAMTVLFTSDTLQWGSTPSTLQATALYAPLDVQRATSTAGPELHLVPIGGHPIVLSQGSIDIGIGGVFRSFPLTALADSVEDGLVWRAGDDVCIVGPAASCLTEGADEIEVAIFVNGQFLYRQTHYLRGFEILPTGGVLVHCTAPVDVIVIGSDITYGAGGPQIPVTLQYTSDNGTTLAPIFGGGTIAAGMSWVAADTQAGDIIGVKARAKYSKFDASYASYVSDPHIKVLKDGDAAPSVPAFGNQASVESFLQPYVDATNRTMTLAYNEVIYLIEFNGNLASPAADFQDAVVLLRFPIQGC